MSELFLYQTEDGLVRIQLRAEDGNVWLNQLEIAELFATTKQNVSLHAKNILEDKELDEKATVKESLTVQTEGNRQVKRSTTFYSLPMILAIGYRVRSPRGNQFRQWASAHLSEYLLKGFVIDDERLKNPGGWDYFDELLARIRDIRASEKRFYQKVRDLFALSRDYQSSDSTAQVFFAEVQNKLLYAVTQQTAAEIIVARAAPSSPNMALTTWSGAHVRKHDVVVAKNYLTADEVDTLNRLVVIFLEQAELRVKDRKELSLDFWRSNVDKLLEFNDKPILRNAGKISNDQMKQIAKTRYDSFDAARREAEARTADADDLQMLEAVVKNVEKNHE
ncbi:virulence RhuM family protein [Undibacterium sp. FT147W]|uniref:Virulence RhuM family protein n=1 Tax=Undibacterium rivi TaxID=2828729 RepID=A0ABS5GXJ0_9BURK|nr:virulence RhuM family protein [Undibacterium rivi]MBR7791170.1 virulence RhuM family protein [Undibacterium rivi]